MTINCKVHGGRSKSQSDVDVIEKVDRKRDQNSKE